MDKELEISLRKYNKNIELGGQAMIIFGVWSIIKVILPLLVGQQTIAELLAIDTVEVEDYLTLIIFFAFMGLILLFHFRMGSSAIKYAKGTKNKKGFLVRAYIILIMNIVFFPFYFIGFKEGNISNTIIASMLVDITVIVSLFDLIISTYKVGKIRKQFG
ncbi:hypothetical protein [Butyrivibrio sp. YAB3001]|uniref:hypothetical protein n=1 Tax=Butyrivibrio sp. YAB3001 TaxID=1520812 RepID=UPI0008F652DE|nr:hypothetical protein [Butyrivibrio sp. YAB3001]SFD09000.1 hypothetical protein SAMN02910398_04019 [Butyrivibrio sp. YAB3001]